MSRPLGFELPYLIGGIPSPGDVEGCQTNNSVSCCSGNNVCVDDYGCGAGLAISAIGAGIGIVIAIVPTNAAPG